MRLAFVSSQHRWTLSILGAATILAAVLALDLVSVVPSPRRAAIAPKPAPTPPRGEIVALIVLDDVRADRMGLCGHARPTTPFLTQTCDAPNALCRCRAYAPGSWTIPSHASFFTGLGVEEHGVGSPTNSRRDERNDVFYRTLPDSVPTLAEWMGDRGYRTVAVSANPVLNATSGLLRGFEEQIVAESFSQFRGEKLVDLVRGAVEPSDPEGRPLFLFVNVADAHEPWLPVPEDLDWLPRRSYLRFEAPVENYNTRFMRGELESPESAALLAHLSDVYDYGVYRADDTLRQIIDTLRETGWLDGAHRLVITSDHGELLGEHDALGHGAPLLYEGLSRVPLVVLSSPPAEATLPDPVSTITVFDLLRGESVDRTVHAAAFAAPGWKKRYGDRWALTHGAAVWTETDRFMFLDGEALRFDLEHESPTSAGQPLPDGPEMRHLEALSGNLERAAAAAVPEGSEEITRMLRALGYVE